MLSVVNEAFALLARHARSKSARRAISIVCIVLIVQSSALAVNSKNPPADSKRSNREAHAGIPKRTAAFARTTPASKTKGNPPLPAIIPNGDLAITAAGAGFPMMLVSCSQAQNSQEDKALLQAVKA